MPSLCGFGRSVIAVVEDNVELIDDDFWIPDEWRLYHEIENLFTGADWIDGGEALDLRNRVEELETEVSQLEEDSRSFEEEASRVQQDIRDLEGQVSDLRAELRAEEEGY